VEIIPDTILNLLRCPISFTSLRMASDEERRMSEQVSGKNCEQAVISVDGRHLYPVDDGIPLLIPQTAIDLSSTKKSELATTGQDANLRRSAR